MSSKDPEQFIRCHKSYVINRDKITEYDKKGSLLTLVGGHICPISRTAKKLFVTA